jgi:hypothetical protein
MHSQESAADLYQGDLEIVSTLVLRGGFCPPARASTLLYRRRLRLVAAGRPPDCAVAPPGWRCPRNLVQMMQRHNYRGASLQYEYRSHFARVFSWTA